MQAEASQTSTAAKRRAHLFIINPRSFRGERSQAAVVNEIHTCFSPGRCNDVHQVYISPFPRSAIGYIRNYLDTVDDDTIVRVYAVGGDGILSDCLNGIYDVPGTELAAIPYGSSNDFIRSFGDGHIETFRSIAKQIAAPTIPTDIMVTGDGQAILGFFVSGIEALIRYRYLSFLKNFNRQSNPANWITSWFYYVLAIPAMCTRHMRAGNYQIILDWGQEYIHDEGSINLANAPCYGGNKQPNYRAMPNDGYMDLIFLREENLLGDILRIPGYLSGRAYDDPERYIYRRIRHLEIKAATPVPMDNDDEIFLGSSISIEVRHHALQFAAPDGLQYQTRAGAL